MSRLSRKLLKQADEMCRVAAKIYHYRCDVLDDASRVALRGALDRVQDLKDDRELTEEAPLQAAMEALEAQMRVSGGSYFPKRGLNENIEVLLVAAILAIGIRMFFIQPFRIPTNSMYPTYNGMTFVVFHSQEDTPSAFMRPFRAVAFGASRFVFEAPDSGEIVIPVYRSSGSREGFALPGRAVPARKWLGLLPTTNAEYVVIVGDKPMADFGSGGCVVLPYGRAGREGEGFPEFRHFAGRPAFRGSHELSLPASARGRAYRVPYGQHRGHGR
jgi:signal peptidase I